MILIYLDPPAVRPPNLPSLSSLYLLLSQFFTPLPSYNNLYHHTIQQLTFNRNQKNQRHRQQNSGDMSVLTKHENDWNKFTKHKTKTARKGFTDSFFFYAT